MICVATGADETVFLRILTLHCKHLAVALSVAYNLDSAELSAIVACVTK